MRNSLKWYNTFFKFLIWCCSLFWVDDFLSHGREIGGDVNCGEKSYHSRADALLSLWCPTSRYIHFIW